jgi:hypothetical protein
MPSGINYAIQKDNYAVADVGFHMYMYILQGSWTAPCLGLVLKLMLCGPFFVSTVYTHSCYSIVKKISKFPFCFKFGFYI